MSDFLDLLREYRDPLLLGAAGAVVALMGLFAGAPHVVIIGVFMMSPAFVIALGCAVLGILYSVIMVVLFLRRLASRPLRRTSD